MRTNLEKFNHWKSLLEEKAMILLISELGQVPEQIWEIGSQRNEYEPEPWTVTGTRVSHVRGTYFKKRPSKDQVELMRSACDEPIAADAVILEVQYARPTGGTTTMAFTLAAKGEKWQLNASEWADKVLELQDLYILKDDQFSCAYCRKATDHNKKVTSAVIARQFPGMRKEFDYCSSQCAAYNQMAHEG